MPRLHCGVHGPPEKRSLTSAHPRLPPAEAEEAASTGISFTYVPSKRRMAAGDTSGLRGL